MSREKLTYSYKEAADVLGKSRATICRMVRLSKIRTVRPCLRPEIPASEIKRLRGAV